MGYALCVLYQVIFKGCICTAPPRNGAIGLFKPTIQKCASTVIRQSMAMEAQACMSYSLSPRWTYAG
ncbi:hypothetical protein V2G26_017810 [Clonostachys chloroleuca]